MTIIDLIRASFEYGFMLRAVIVGVMIAVSSSFLGSFLVLKKYSLIGEGLAHVSFAAVAIALFFDTAPLFVSLPLVSLAAIFILRLSENSNITGDAAIGLLASFSVALATILASTGGGFTTDLYSYLFGSILLLTNVDVWISVILSGIVILVVVFNFHPLFMMTYDETFAKVRGIKTKRLNYLLAVLTAITVLIGIRSLGVMLISSLIIFPTVIALQFFRGFRQTILIAVSTSVVLMVFGLFTSFLFDLPTGSTIVILNGIVFFLVYLFNILTKRSVA